VASRPSPLPEVGRLPLLLRQASRAADALVLAALRRPGDEGRDGSRPPTMLELHALVLAGQGRPISAIARDLRLTPQHTARLVAQLVASGLVEKVPHPRDARAVLVLPTPEGCELVDAARDAVTAALHLWADDLADGRLEQLAGDLELIAEADQERSPWDRW
jgi:DNA-binding MarR family transcriptional regulator